jgi:hypothetical protein
MSRQCSSKSTVGDSPVPTMTIPDVPLAIWKSISLRSAGRVERAVGVHRRHDRDQLPVSFEDKRFDPEKPIFYPNPNVEPDQPL